MIGQSLGPYQILAELGRGGMGEVFRARDPRLGRDVAIKVLPEAFTADVDRRARFEREAQTVAALSHPNIVNVFDTGAEQGRLFVVMELLSGETLREQLKHGALAPRKAIDIGIQVARGLAAAHDKGLVHRDLKPENIFLLPDGHVKILDFGLARIFAPDAAGDTGNTRTAALTDPGIVMGTVGYMAPEQVRGQNIDARTDLFALGAVLYEMLAGRHPFHRDTSADTMTAILKEDPPDISASRPDVPPALDRIVRHALEKNPVERFQTARDVAFALGALSGSGTAAQPTVNAPASRGWLKLAGIGAAAVVLVGAGALAGSVLQPRVASIEYIAKTFDSNVITVARFMPDGKTILYAARLPDGSLRLFELRDSSVAPKMIGPPNTTLLAISRTGEYAVLTQVTTVSALRAVGTLSRMTFGEEPRAVIDNVAAADWSPDGASFAIVRRVDGLDRLEYPVGHVLYKTTGYVSDVRISPDGKRVLFMDHATLNDDRGWVRIADADATTTLVAGEFAGEQGAAWTPDGDRVLFSGGRGDQVNRVWTAKAPRPGASPPAVTELLTVPASMVVQDVSADGALLTTTDMRRYLVGAKLKAATSERDLTWLDMSWSPSLSADGTKILFSDGHGFAGYSVVVRRTDGSSISRLGPGSSLSISPDGSRAVAIDLTSTPQKLIVYPTGSGNPATLPAGNITKYEPDEDVPWFPDQRTFVFRGAEGDKRSRLYKQSLDGGPPVPIVGDNVRAPLLAPDGRSLIGLEADQKWRRFPLDGSKPADVPGLTIDDIPVAWTSDGRGVVVATKSIPAKLERVELATGARKLIREIHAPGLDSFRITVRTASADAEQFAYSGVRTEKTLYLVKNVAGIK